MKKRLFALVLALCMVLNMVPITALAADVIAGGDWNFGPVTWKITSDGTLTIGNRASGVTVNFQSASNYVWKEYSDVVTKIVISDNIRNIPEHAFSGMENVKEVSLGNKIEKIQEFAFWNCPKLEEIALPSSLIEISEDAFRNCSALKYVYFHKDCKLTVIPDRAFQGCGLIELTTPSSLTTIEFDAFKDCSDLRKLILQDGITEVMKDAFANCTSLEEVYCPPSLNQIYNNAFTGSNAVKKITYDGPVFSLANQPDLTTVVIGPNAEEIPDSCFTDCTSLSRVVIPSNINKIGYGAFEGCSSLTSLTLSENLKNLPTRLITGTGITSLTVPKSVTQVEMFPFTDSRIQKVTFLGDPPVFDMSTFAYMNSGITVYYPADNPKWTADVMKDYGGDVTWLPIGADSPGVPTANVARIYGATRYETAFRAANELKTLLGVSKFDNIIVASGTSYADALSGSYLATVKSAPILLVKSGNEVDVKSYIRNNLIFGGTVYLLGGTAAIPASMETGLDGFTVKRLGGATRYDTNLLILEEAGFEGKDLIICTGNNFADSLSASALGLPIMLVGDGLRQNQKDFLSEHYFYKYILGGYTAVPQFAENQIKQVSRGGYERIAGENRYETSMLIAREFFESADSVVLAYALNYPDGLCAGPLAYQLNAPLFLTSNGKEANIVSYTTRQNISAGYVLGGPGLISDNAAKKIFAMTTDESIAVK